MSLHIITKKPNNYLSREFLKEIARKILNKKRGPQAVVASLVRGLDSLGVEYKLNSIIENTDVLYVNESVDALYWAIELKKNKKISRLIAGPNIVVTPDESNSLVAAPEIDLYLNPSNWTRNWWLSIRPALAPRLAIWAAGIKDAIISDNGNRDTVIVYKKNVPEDVYQKTLQLLDEKAIKYRVINYGQFKQEEYFELLSRSYALIYLQELESQGIALLEAWCRNVPTLVWNSNSFKYKNYTWTDQKISAPYLSDESGSFFANYEELSLLLDSILDKNKLYSPRNYYLNNFTDEICASNFLKTIKYEK